MNFSFCNFTRRATPPLSVKAKPQRDLKATWTANPTPLSSQNQIRSNDAFANCALPVKWAWTIYNHSGLAQSFLFSRFSIKALHNISISWNLKTFVFCSITSGNQHDFFRPYAKLWCLFLTTAWGNNAQFPPVHHGNCILTWNARVKYSS